MLLDFGHGPVLALQTFLLTLSHLLQVKENSLIKESRQRALTRILLHPELCHVSCQQKQRLINTLPAVSFTWASLTRTRPRLFSSFMICRMAILTSTCTRFCTSDTWRILMDKTSQARKPGLGTPKPWHWNLRASNLLGVFLQCGMFVPKAFHQ